MNISVPKYGVECGILGMVSSDDRRDISEINFNTSAFQAFLIKDGCRPLGQHYHAKKFEIFSFLEGAGLIRTARVNLAGQIIGEEAVHKVSPGFTLHIPPYYAHRFDLSAGTRFFAFSSSSFDPDDNIPCSIE